ncbi:hypothetical protein ACSQ67_020926 [Phaseolus vulgaris]
MSMVKAQPFMFWVVYIRLISSDRAEKLRQMVAPIECNVKLLGATRIEDKLQEGVPEATESIWQAGIKIIINGTSEVECRKLLTDAITKCSNTGDGQGKTIQQVKDLRQNDEEVLVSVFPDGLPENNGDLHKSFQAWSFHTRKHLASNFDFVLADL